MKNEEILKENDGKRYDICLMNPPYGTTGGDVIHLKFVDKCLDIANKNIVVMPFGFVTKILNKTQNKYKEKFSKYLTTVEETDANLFTGTAMANVGIYNFDSNKKENSYITINYINKESEELKSLLDKSFFSNYEENIIKYLKEQGQQLIVHCGEREFRPLIRKDNSLKKLDIKSLLILGIKHSNKKLKEYLNQDNVYALMVNQTNYGKNGKAIDKTNDYGLISNNFSEIEQWIIEKNASKGFNAIILNSKKEAENCRDALLRPLLRFTIYRTQVDQSMYPNKVYKYVPDVDWSDDRVKTDEGLLEVCGCPKDKCKEYADYCKKIIDEVDKK